MATFYNRVQVQATSTGTAAFSLGLAVPAYNNFSGVPNQTYVDYLAVASDNTWEIGVGQYNATPNTLTRVSVESSSNANALVNFAIAPTISVVANASFFNASSGGGVTPGQTVLNGPTNGTITWSQPFQVENYKKFVAYFSEYENDTATSQSITFPMPFVNVPFVTSNSSALAVTLTTTAITITAPNNTTLYSGYIILEGY